MSSGLRGYSSPSMITDETIRNSLHGHIAAVLEALSTPNSDVAKYFAHPDIAIAGSGLDEFFMGPEQAQEGTTWVSTLDVRWSPQTIVSWQRGDIAWAQVRISASKKEGSTEISVPYVMTGVFAREEDSWTLLYWGGAEPQDPPKV